MAQETRFTPGPWHTAKMHPRHVCNKVGFKVAKCLEVTKGLPGLVVSREEAKANAHLISAAPELYEALAAAEELYQIGLITASNELINRVAAARRAALAKARGEA